MPVQGIHARRAILPKRFHKITNTIGNGLSLPLLGVIRHHLNRNSRRVGLASEMYDRRVADLIDYQGTLGTVYLKALSPWKLRGECILGRKYRSALHSPCDDGMIFDFALFNELRAGGLDRRNLPE